MLFDVGGKLCDVVVVSGVGYVDPGVGPGSVGELHQELDRTSIVSLLGVEVHWLSGRPRCGLRL